MSKLKKGISVLLAGVVAVTCVVAFSATAYADRNLAPNCFNNCRCGRIIFFTDARTTSLSISGSWTSARPNRDCDNFFGIGWRVGTLNRRLGYNVDYLNQTSGTRGMTIAAFYGWTRNPLIEYHVIEMWQNHRSTPGQRLGTLNTDGGTYDIFRAQRNGYNIDGFGPFIQIKSVRTVSAPTGQNRTITFQNHVNAWRVAGQPLGSAMHYQVFKFGGWESDGRGSMTVWSQ